MDDRSDTTSDKPTTVGEYEGVPLLGELLDLDAVGADRYRGRTQPRPAQRLFGGVLLAQSIAAAGRTVQADRPVHSMHALFVRGASPAEHIEYSVDRVRDGGSTSARRVIARQGGLEVFSATVSFQRGRGGVRHQKAFPSAPSPDTLLSLHERLARDGVDGPDWWKLPRAIDLRHVDEPPYPPRQRPDDATRHLVWIKARETLPEDPLIHACALAYASDMTLLEPVMLRHGLDRHAPRLRMASLDHAMWFHQEVFSDDWLLYDQDSPVGEDGRVLAQGTVFDPAGRQVATVAQEALLSVG